MGLSPLEVRRTGYGDFQAAFRGWQMSQGIEPEGSKQGRIMRDDLRALMDKYPDEVVH